MEARCWFGGIVTAALLGCGAAPSVGPLGVQQVGPAGMVRQRSGLPTESLVDPATRPSQERSGAPTDVLVDPATRPWQKRSGLSTPYLMSPEVYRPEVESLLALGSSDDPDNRMYRRLLTVRFSRHRPEAIYFTGTEYTYVKFAGANQRDIFGYYCFGRNRSACGNGGMVFDYHPLE